LIDCGTQNYTAA